MATLHELRTIYDLEDAMQMWECIMVKQYNELQAPQKTKIGVR